MVVKYLPPVARTVTLLACVAVAVSCGADLVLPSNAVPATVAIVQGDKQTGTVGTALANPIAVRVMAVGGRPLPGERVAFVSTAPGSQVSPDTVLTDATGQATSSWVLGTLAGTQQLEAKVLNSALPQPLIATFTASAAAGPPVTFIEVGGQDQVGPPLQQLPDSLAVRADDEFGNPVPDVSVTWEVTRGNGTLSATNTLTGRDGRTAVTWTLGFGPIRQTVEATLDLTDDSVKFTATATFGLTP